MCVFASMQKLSSLALLVSALVGCAWGQTYEVTVGGGLARMSTAPLGSVSSDDPKDDDTSFKKNAHSYGLRLTYNPYAYYGHEVGYRLTRASLRTSIPDADGNRTTFEDKVAIHQAFYNFLIYFMPKGEWWRPYITGGVHAYNFANPHIAGWTGIGTRNYGVNYGGGLKLKLFNHALVRLDVRDYITTKPYNLTSQDPINFSGWGRHQEASVGIGIGF